MSISMMLNMIGDDPAMVLLGILCLVALLMIATLIRTVWRRRHSQGLPEGDRAGTDSPDPFSASGAGTAAGAALTEAPPAAKSEPTKPEEDPLPGLAERRRLLEEAARTVAEGEELIRRLDRMERGGEGSDTQATREKKKSNDLEHKD